MKLKKTLSGVLAAAMVVSLTPAMAFASTTNTVVSVPTVATDEVIGSDVVISLKNTSGVDLTSGTIKIAISNGTFETKAGAALGDSDANINDYIRFTDGTKAFALTAESLSDTSAKFSFTNAQTASQEFTVGTDGKVQTPAGTKAQTYTYSTSNSFWTGADATTTAAFTFVAGSTTTSVPDSASITVVTASNVITNNYAYLVIDGKHIKTGEAGEVQITIDGLDSTVTSGTYTVAIAGSGRTTAEVTGTVSTVARGSIDSNAKIEISETSINAIPSAVNRQVIKLTLPKDCEWKSVTLGGAASVNGTLTATTNISDASNIGATSGPGLYPLSSEKKIAYLVVTPSFDPAKRDTITIQPSFTIGKETPEGDITVDVVGYKAFEGSTASNKTVNDASGLVVNVYGEESVQVIAPQSANLPEIIAGKKQTNKDKDFTVKVTLKENMAKALQAGRYVDFDFPEEVQVTDVKYVVSKNTDASMSGSLKTVNSGKNLDLEDTEKKDASGFSFLVPSATDEIAGWDKDKKNTVTLEIHVSVEAGYTGDITVDVTGAKAGVDDTTLTVGTVITPITATAASTNIKTGLKGQAVADITITENIAGYLKDGKDLIVGLETLGLSKGIAVADFDSVTVTEGNLELGKAKISTETIGDIDGDAIVIPVKSSSSKASTIVIKGVELNLNRTMPEGGYQLQVCGGAAVENGKYNDSDFTGVATSIDDYAVIVTPADSVTVSEKVDAQFVIGEASYTNNGTATEMDAAAYIDSHNRTMVPIRYVANACGISENDIRWEAGSQTAIINGLNTVVTVKMGSNKLQTSTGEITMDTVAVNNNGRIYVPVRYIANALGANVSWDAATKTVTLTK